jgi:hypothetical protein
MGNLISGNSSLTLGSKQIRKSKQHEMLKWNTRKAMYAFCGKLLAAVAARPERFVKTTKHKTHGWYVPDVEGSNMSLCGQ